MTSRSFLSMDRRTGSAAVLRNGALLAVVMVLTALLSSPPASAQYSPGGGVDAEVDGALTLGANSVVAGAQLTVSGDGFQADSDVLIVFQSSPTTLGTVTTDSSGSFSTQVTIPADALAGAHTITATGPAPDGGTRVLRSPITLQLTQALPGQPSNPGSGAGGLLPRTGAGIAALVGVALAAWLVGSVLVAASRRHKPVSQKDSPSAGG